MKNQTLQSRVLRCALVIIFVFACALCVSSAQAADNKLTLIENHVMVTKGGVEEPANSDEIYNTMSNYATITYDDEGNGTVKGLIGSIDGASYHTIVKMAGISDGSTIDITNECEILDVSNAIVKIPAEYMKQFGEDGTRPVLYTVINGDTVSDSSLFYHEVYVSVNVDGEEIYLPDSRYAEDPNNPSLHQNYTINGHDNYRFMNVQGNYIKTGLGMGNTPQGPFNVNEIFGGDNSFLNYNIDKVEVYTVQDNETMFDTARVVDNANNQYFVLDSKTNQINGLDKLFCFRVAVRIEATTKTDIKTNIINPRLQDSMIDWHGVGDNEFTLMRVNGYEYSCDDGKTWQTNPHFTGLTAGTTYHVLQRPVGSTGHSKRLNVTTTGTAPVEPFPDAPQPVVWTPPFNVGDTFTANGTQSVILPWEQNGTTIFNLDGSFSDAKGNSYEIHTIGHCVSPGFNCRGYSANTQWEVTCIDINTNTGVCTFKIFSKGRQASPALQNAEATALVQIAVAGNIELWKKSSNEDITNGNSCYSLEGAVYTVYGDSGCTNVVGSMTTNASGYAFLGNVNPGTYWVKETNAAKGYTLDDTAYETYVAGGCTASVNNGVVYDTPQNDPVGILLGKVDRETTKSNALGGATLAKAQFEVTYYDVQGQGNQNEVSKTVVDGIAAQAKTSRTWVFETNERGTIIFYYETPISGDSCYKDSKNENTLPLGTVVIREVNAPSGYLNSNEGKYWVRSVTVEGNKESVETYNPPNGDTAFKEQVKRGDVEWVKIENGTNESYQNPLAGVPFIIRSKTTGEEHVVVSDANGIVKTQSDWNKHSYKTNGNDAAVTKQADGTYVVDETKLDAECGVWFGINSTVNDNLNALPYDDYEIQELSVRVNKGYRLVTKSFTIYKDKNNVNIGTITNEVEPFGGIKITKTSSAPSALTLAGAEFGIYSSPIDNEKFLIRTITTDESGFAISGDTFDLPGESNYYVKEIKAPTGYVAKEKFYRVYVTSQQWAEIGNMQENLVQNDPIYGGVSVEKKDAETNSFTGQGAATMDGTTFNIVNKNDYKVYVEGKWYNTGDVVKTLVTKDGKATTDEDCLPYGKYTIQEVKSGEGYTLGDGVPREFSIVQEGVILDTFTGDGAFTNTVIKGDVHLVKVAEIDQSRMANIVFKLTSLATGEVWTLTTDENGEAYTEGYALPYGKYKLEEIESKENEDYVMITLDEISISKDKTIVDLGTLVNKLRPDPTLSTTATDKADGDKVLALGGTQTVVDAVSFENLRTDRKYTMVGVLHYVNEDGSDGGEVEGSETQVVFTPEAENGEVQVDLNVDTSNLEGKSIVVFEECRQHLVYEDEKADEIVDETDTSLDVEADETDTVDETTGTKAESYRVVATHMDIADEGQTVSVETLPESETLVQTGDTTTTMQSMFLLFIISFGFCSLVALKQKLFKISNKY